MSGQRTSDGVWKHTGKLIISSALELSRNGQAGGDAPSGDAGSGPAPGGDAGTGPATSGPETNGTADPPV